MVKKGTLRGLQVDEKIEAEEICGACGRGQSFRRSKKTKKRKHRAKATKFLQRIFVDVQGPYDCLSTPGKYRYLLVAVDEYSGKQWLRPMRKKTDVRQVLTAIQRRVTASFDYLRVDVRPRYDYERGRVCINEIVTDGDGIFASRREDHETDDSFDEEREKETQSWKQWCFDQLGCMRVSWSVEGNARTNAAAESVGGRATNLIRV